MPEEEEKWVIVVSFPEEDETGHKDHVYGPLSEKEAKEEAENLADFMAQHADVFEYASPQKASALPLESIVSFKECVDDLGPW